MENVQNGTTNGHITNGAAKRKPKIEPAPDPLEELRCAVDGAIQNIEGVCVDARDGINDAAAAFMHLFGELGRGALEPALECSAGVTKARDALDCVLSYLDPLRSHLPPLTARRAEAAEARAGEPPNAYALDCLDEAVATLERLTGLVVLSAEGMADEDKATFRELAAGLATNINGARDSLRSA